MADSRPDDVVKLVVDKHPTTGEPVFENVLVESAGGDAVKLRHTPGLALGVAAGDIIRIDPDDHSYEVVSRGGNVAVQVYGPPEVTMSIEPRIREIGGWHDGGVRNLTIYTVPVKAGFPALEAILRSLPDDPEVEWFYGNVYGKDGVTPLNWWSEPK